MGYFMHKKFMDEAIKEAEISLSEGGIPIGAVLQSRRPKYHCLKVVSLSVQSL